MFSRWITLLVSFYIAVSIAQAPMVQALMPEYVRNLLYTEMEDYYLSVIVPGAEFTPDEEYQSSLVPMDRSLVETALAGIVLLEKSADYPDVYTFKSEAVITDIHLYSGDSIAEVTEIEISVPVSDKAAIAAVVDLMAQIAERIPGSELFDYNHERVYSPGEKDVLLNRLLIK